MKVNVPQQAEDRQTILMVAGLLFFVMILIAPIMTFSEVLSGQARFTGEGSTQRQLGYVLVLGLAIYGAVRQGRGARALIMPLPILLALGWCWLSLLWAVDVNIGARRLVLTTIAVWTTFIIVQGAGYERSMFILRVALVGALAGNYLTVLLDPQVGIHLQQDASASTALVGNWRGFMVHKNFAGAATAITILLFVFDARHIRPQIRWSVIALSAFFLFKTQSKTSAGMIVIALLIGWIFQRYDRRIRTYAIPIIMFLTAAFWFLYSTYSDFVLERYLAPAAFTGRGLIWNAMLRYAADHLLLGAGFGSFWNIGAGSPIYEYGQGFVREVTVGHNGYLDLLISIGLPGLLLAIYAAIIWPVWRLLVSNIKSSRGALAVALLLFCLGHNITESSLFERDSLIGVLMMVGVAIAQNWREAGEARQGSGRGQTDVFAALRQRARERG